MSVPEVADVEESVGIEAILDLSWTGLWAWATEIREDCTLELFDFVDLLLLRFWEPGVQGAERLVPVVD